MLSFDSYKSIIELKTYNLFNIANKIFELNPFNLRIAIMWIFKQYTNYK